VGRLRLRPGPQGALRGGDLLLAHVPRSAASRCRGPHRRDLLGGPFGLHVRRRAHAGGVPRPRPGRRPVRRRVPRGPAPPDGLVPAGPAPAAIVLVAAAHADATCPPDALPLAPTGLGTPAAAVAVTRELAPRSAPAAPHVVTLSTAGAPRDRL